MCACERITYIHKSEDLEEYLSIQQFSPGRDARQGYVERIFFLKKLLTRYDCIFS